MWIVNSAKYESYEIVGTNIHKTEEGMYQLWVTKVSNKTAMVAESENEEDIRDYKDAIDYAMKENKPVFTI